MSADAGLDILKAVRAALVGDATVFAAVGQRIFSTWDNDADAPLIRLWVGASVNFEMDGANDGSETDFQVNVFANDIPTCRQIASRVRDVLKDAELSLDGSDTLSFLFKNIIPARDEDPTLQMSVVRFVVTTTSK